VKQIPIRKPLDC